MRLVELPLLDDFLSFIEKVFVIKNNLKTINGNSLIGDGNITINGGSNLKRFLEDGYTEILNDKYDTAIRIGGGEMTLSEDVLNLNVKDLQITDTNESGLSFPFRDLFTPTSNLPLNELGILDNIEVLPDEELTIGALIERMQLAQRGIVTNESRTHAYLIAENRIYLSSYTMFESYEQAAEMAQETGKLCYVFSSANYRWDLALVVSQQLAGDLGGLQDYFDQNAVGNVVGVDELVKKIINRR